MTEMEGLADSLAYLTATLSSGPNPFVVVISTTAGQTHNHIMDAANARKLAANLGKLADHLDPPEAAEPKKEWHVFGDVGGKMTAKFDDEVASAILQNARKRSTKRPAKKNVRKGKRK